ncbi:hypothetical protein QWJ90_00215 [Microbacterium oryzae]|uniref:hypothetical protein n=1 Tax=Microbacterium oryzae TaxID=743009 RepID=UPI0025B25BEB|nr:hypothetical protein [Microbacterium oryzae]MDN3309351.1 hypothetical protein [Microbacterium oryzae]
MAVIACAAAAAAAGAVASHVALAQPARVAVGEFAAGGGEAVDLELSVTSKVERRGEALWFDAEASAVRRGDETLQGLMSVTVSVAADAAKGEKLDLGSVATVNGSAIAGDAGDRAVLVVFACETEVLAAPPALLAIAAGLRDTFVERASTLPQPGSMLLPGLAVGDTRAVSEDLDTAMKAASLSHLLAVSGAVE